MLEAINIFIYTVLSSVNFMYSDYFTAIKYDLLDTFMLYFAAIDYLGIITKVNLGSSRVPNIDFWHILM